MFDVVMDRKLDDETVNSKKLMNKAAYATSSLINYCFTRVTAGSILANVLKRARNMDPSRV